MKNVLFMLAFMLMGTFAFANNEAELVNEDTKMETSNVEKNSQEDATLGCIHVSLSCDVEYDICDFTGTFQQLINVVLLNNDLACGSSFMD